ncbi:MAG: PspA/IM30 family protein [Armatimonadetes bacterium]|nr:PspA/IM30 family protein [Armatimonadota bacterium]
MTAGLWLFLFRLLTGFFRPKPEPPLDPEVLLQQAQQEMRENQAKNRTRAVEAITQKNNLQAELGKTRKIVDNLQAKADLAASHNDFDLRHQLLGERQHYLLLLARQQALLDKATETTEMIKAAIRGEEERIRRKTAEAMALRTMWKQSQIVASLPMPLEQATADEATVQKRLDDVLQQIEKTRGRLIQEAQAAIVRGDLETALSLLSEQQDLGQALVPGYGRA